MSNATVLHAKRTWSRLPLFFSRVFKSYKDAQTPRDHIVLQDRQVAQRYA
jgi:hypothetical protein